MEGFSLLDWILSQFCKENGCTVKRSRNNGLYNPRTMDAMLAGLDAATFLRRHWQKRLLLARRALPQYENLVTRDTLFELAARDELQSRLVTRFAGRWDVQHGPFTRSALSRLPLRGWTLLVHGLNHVLPQAQDLLLEFDFIPYARVDDVMVSYAPPGGGVGPHFDSYDVFLLQLKGTRRWRVSRQRDLSLIEGAPLKLLRRFRAEHEWRLAPGDMLYLPPHVAHDGVAVDECLTASVGFRAPGAQELGTRFLEFMQEEIALEGHYRDPDLRPQRKPAQLGTDMLRRCARMLAAIRWDADAVLQFLGQYLTEPKAHIVFQRPRRPLAERAFMLRAMRHGVALDLRSSMLYRGPYIFLNGERHEIAGKPARMLLEKLADRRRLDPAFAIDDEAMAHLHEWYRAGYIHVAVRAELSEA
jgi:50S ribosomal protein L16 3-hydroxylase